MDKSNSNANISIDQVDSKVYEFKFSQRLKKYTLISIAVFLLAFLLNFPVKDQVRNKVKSALLANQTCPVSYDSINVSFFLPDVSIHNPIIPARCLSRNSQAISLKKLSFSPYWPSLFPIGPRFSIPLLSNKTKLNIYPTLSFSGIHINVKESKLHSDILTKLIPMDLILKGAFSINAITSIPYSMGPPKEGKFHIKSKDLIIPPANIRGFQTPSLPLHNFSLKGEINGRNIQISELIMGDKSSPLKTMFSGSILINPQGFIHSSLDLKGTLYLSDKLLKEFAIIKFKLGEPDSQNQYHLKLRGSIARPNPKPISK